MKNGAGSIFHIGEFSKCPTMIFEKTRRTFTSKSGLVHIGEFPLGIPLYQLSPKSTLFDIGEFRSSLPRVVIPDGAGLGHTEVIIYASHDINYDNGMTFVLKSSGPWATCTTRRRPPDTACQATSVVCLNKTGQTSVFLKRGFFFGRGYTNNVQRPLPVSALPLIGVA